MKTSFKIGKLYKFTNGPPRTFLTPLFKILGGYDDPSIGYVQEGSIVMFLELDWTGRWVRVISGETVGWCAFKDFEEIKEIPEEEGT